MNQAERRIEILLKDENGIPNLEVIKSEDLREEIREPKIRKRIVFGDDEEESPF